MNFITVNRGNKAAHDVHNYSGVRHSFTFKLKAPLPLAGLKFFGPYKNKPSDIEVYISLKESRINPVNDACLQNIYPETKFSIKEVLPQTPFEVLFPRPILVPQDMWVDILFELEGPPTLRLEKRDREVVTLYDEGRTMKIDCLWGSGQPKELYFLLP